MISPSALLLLGAGVAVGLALGLPVLAAIGLGLLAWVVRVGFTAFERPATPRVKVSPAANRGAASSLDAQAAKDRFDRAVRRWTTGRSVTTSASSASASTDGVDEGRQIARRGQEIDEALASIDVAACRQELDELRRSGETGIAADRTAEALRAQLASAARMEAVVREAPRPLRLLDARLDELVARAVEVSVSAGDTTRSHARRRRRRARQGDGVAAAALEETRRGGPIDHPGVEQGGPQADGGALRPRALRREPSRPPGAAARQRLGRARHRALPGHRPAALVALAYALGQACLTDAYNLANNSPNAVYELLLGGVLSATLCRSSRRSSRRTTTRRPPRSSACRPSRIAVLDRDRGARRAA